MARILTEESRKKVREWHRDNYANPHPELHSHPKRAPWFGRTDLQDSKQGWSGWLASEDPEGARNIGGDKNIISWHRASQLGVYGPRVLSHDEARDQLGGRLRGLGLRRLVFDGEKPEPAD